MEVERKKQKGINPNHWMCRIQKTVLNIDAPSFYMGYCPFFWMTWVAILAFIPAMVLRYVIDPFAKFVWKFAGGGLSAVGSKIANKIEQYEGRKQSTPLAPNLYKIWTRTNLCNFDWSKTLSETDRFRAEYELIGVYKREDRFRIILWLEQNPNWVEQYKNAQKASELSKQKKEEFKKKACSMIGKVSFIGPIFVKIVVPILISVAVYILVRLVWGLILVITSVPLLDWLAVGIVISSLAALIMFIFIAIDFIKTFISPNFGDWAVSVAKALACPFVFIYETVNMAYKQECPLIVWGEETTPITKINKE